MKSEQQKQSRTTRRGIFAGLMSLPALAVAGRRHVQPDVVRQSELQALVDSDTRHRAAIAAIRKRMRDGAIVEPGEIHAKSDSEEGYPLEWTAQPVGGFYANGLGMDW